MQQCTAKANLLQLKTHKHCLVPTKYIIEMTYNHTQTCEMHPAHAHSGKIKQYMHNVKIADTPTQFRHFVVYNECDKHQRVFTQGFINPQLRNTTERIYSRLGPTLVSLSLSQNNSSYMAQITWPSGNTPGTPTGQQVSHNIHGLSCPDSHIKFMAPIDLLRLQVSTT